MLATQNKSTDTVHNKSTTSHSSVLSASFSNIARQDNLLAGGSDVCQVLLNHDISPSTHLLDRSKPHNYLQPVTGVGDLRQRGYEPTICVLMQEKNTHADTVQIK